MKISTIIQALKLLFGITEQVTSMLAETKIPATEQQHLHEEVDIVLSKLHTAKSKIEIDPPE